MHAMAGYTLSRSLNIQRYMQHGSSCSAQCQALCGSSHRAHFIMIMEEGGGGQERLAHTSNVMLGSADLQRGGITGGGRMG